MSLTIIHITSLKRKTMNLPKLFKIHGLATVITAIAAAMLLTSCNGLIYEDEGDCSVVYRIKFRYDMNLKWADAFANEVKSVRLYAYDKNGTLVAEKTESGAALASEGYSMTLEVPAGDYHLAAWCGLDNGGERAESFSTADQSDYQASLDKLTCRLNSKSDAEHPSYSDEHLFSLFHGTLDVSLPDNPDGGEYVYTMSLTKNTNHIRIILQHLSGEDVDEDDFTFQIEDNNGLMAHDNSLIPDRDIMYRTWSKKSGQAGVGKDDTPAESRGIVYVNGAIADLTVGRMMESHRRDMMLTIKSKDGSEVARVPVIDYALLAKDYYEEAYGHKMSDQEFLDREDEYVMTFFLDRNNQWISSSILIHSWRVVIGNYDV